MSTQPPSARVEGSDRPELEEVRVGYIPLTDCASLIMAAELGFDRRYGLRIVPERQASWAAVRDRLVAGELHASQALYGQVYGIHTGLGGVQEAMNILIALSRNGQAITLSRTLLAHGVRDGESLARHLAQATQRATFAQTFPTGTHAMWLYYWLAAHGIDPMHDIHRIVVPPPDMSINLRRGNMDGFCAGEPWNQHAILEGVGFTVATSQQIWPDHPEKVLATTARFTREYPATARALICAVLEAARWLDASPANRVRAAGLIAAPHHLDIAPATIQGRMLGEYEDGLGRQWQDAHPMQFFADGEASFPWLSDGMWFLAQHQRWGMLGRVEHEQIARSIHRTDLYAEAARALGVSLPARPLRSSVLMDGEVWDGSRPDRYLPPHADPRAR
ncbi:MAG: CmpA/NrtA family ABC transporter substrate-binding protein [Candidatus Dactylopiibacterium sp.]|nr:CmpA/NrtA family ABC transporter substrate-binding protein [Candidatus Dactylopiibacterium sp.]